MARLNLIKQTQGVLSVDNGGTGATTQAQARINLDVPSNSSVVHSSGDENVYGNKTFLGLIKTAALWLRDDAIERHSGDNDTAAVAFNYLGYNGGTTRFRDSTFFNGKAGEIFKIIGATGKIKYTGDGSQGAGKVLTSDANGNATWSTPSGSSSIGVSLTHSAQQTSVLTGLTTLAFDTERHDTGTMHDNSVNNSRITISQSGIYEFHISFTFASVMSGTTQSAQITKNGITTIARRQLYDPAGQGVQVYYFDFAVQDTANIGDYYEVQVQSTANANMIVYGGSPHIAFEAKKL